MGQLWSDNRRFQTMLQVEILACEALAKQGVIPTKALKTIKRKARVTPQRIQEIEAHTKHDVIAFLSNLRESVGPAARFVHLGLTSSDVLDTSMAVLMRDAALLLLEDIDRLTRALAHQARRHKLTAMIGRTHGVHAEPTTFGLKMALFYEEMRRHRVRLQEACAVISVGKISGAVGTYANIDPAVEVYVCRKLGLESASISTQIIQRDRHAQYLTTLALVGGSCEKIATEIRHLQRTEVLEAEEPFSEGQKGSSAMPHKRNPVVCERIVGLARLLRGHALAAMENIALWHERDISHSSVERIIVPDSTIALDYMLTHLTEVIEKLNVYPDRMLVNLERTKGLIFSERVMVEMIKRGAERREAYDAIQTCALQTWKNGHDFKALLANDQTVRRFLDAKALNACFDHRAHLRHVNRVFARLGL